MEQIKVERLSNFFDTLSRKKAEEVKSKHLAGTLTKGELNRLMTFKDLPIDEQEKKELLKDDYISIESRVAVLNKEGFFDECIMIAILFLQDKKDDKALYDSTLKIETKSSKQILFYLCLALNNTKQFLLCQTYIDLLKKLIIAFPSVLDPPIDVLHKISYQAFLNK